MKTASDMQRIILTILAAGLLLGCGRPRPAVDLWTAAGKGDLATLRQHLAAGTDLNAREPTGGSSPLLIAALYGQTEAARLLLGQGARINDPNNDGSTPLAVAAFFGQTATVRLLLDKGADVHVKNRRGETPLETVAGPWTPDLEKLYRALAGALQVTRDLDEIRRARPVVADLLRQHGG